MRCLEENTLFEYVSDGLDRATREAIGDHAASCDACRRLIAAAVHATPSSHGPGHAATTEPSSERLESFTAGRTLAGKYQLVRLIGTGGMGVVHEAINTWTGRRVAVKELHRSFSSDANAVQRFTREAKSASRIAHPNVVDILDLGQDPETGALFMVQELLTGATLRERLIVRGALGIDEVVRVLGPALAALVVAHDAGVVHRDLKPDNIFLARDAFDGEVTKLIDFGLSKELQPEIALDVTGHGRQLGTPFYMSPEQLRGELDLDDRTDVWSMGVVLFEAIAGARPFTGPSYNELVVQILKDPVPRLVDVVPTVPAAISALVARALERDPKQRLRSRELRDALDELARRPEVLAVPQGNPYRGLLPFEPSYRGVFFGRAAEVSAVIDRFRHSPFVLVAGDSGVGKSSLVRAGVLPVIGDAATRVVTATPGPQPVAALAAALAPILDEDAATLAGQLSDDAAAVGARLQRAIAEDEPARPRLVLFFDQLEELVTLADGGEAAFASLALATLLETAPALRLIATVRSDFLARLATLPGLGDEVTAALYLLKPLTAQGVREAVVGPARITGLRFESAALSDELVASAGSSAGELPLLQFALARLWDTRDVKRSMICAASLQALGGVAGALADHADGVLALIPPRHLPLARTILTDLVTEDGTRARKTAAELAADAREPAPEATHVVLETLVQGRLVSVEDRDGAPSYQIAHDVLVEGWGTLRGWRGRDVERGVARQRLARAAAEWERLGRPADALWKAAQLSEAAELAPHNLPAIDAEFLARSRGAVRRLRRLRHAVVLGIPVLLALGFTGARLMAHRRTADAVAVHVRAAEAAVATAATDERDVEQLRTTAFAAFDHGDLEAGERTWLTVLAGQDALDATYRTAGEQLEAALQLDAASSDVRRRFARLLFDRARHAERTYRPVERDELAYRMGTYDEDGSQRARWTAPARVSVTSVPTHATVLVQRVHGRDLVAPIELGTTPVASSLEPGSYIVTLRVADHPEVRSPLLLARGEAIHVQIPIPDQLPPGYVFVPPGRFMYGSSDSEDMRRTMMNAQPLHATSTVAYLIARHEVTFGDWITFLKTLSPTERARRLPNAAETAATTAGAIVSLTEPTPGAFRLKLQPTSRAYTADADQPIHYEQRSTNADQRWLRMPVSGISWDDALAYTAWLDRSGALPGARPCDEHEWERAARGADTRVFPNGDQLAAADANFAETYGRQTEAFGPDEVGTHPASDSPFGVSDLAGNAWEWVTSVSKGEQVAIRGGSWYHNPLAARSNNREPSEPSLRSTTVGLRVCAGGSTTERFLIRDFTKRGS